MRNVARLVAALVTVASASASAADPPRPPCGAGNPIPAYGKATDPAIESWSKLEWQAPACVGWNDLGYKFVIAIAGRIEATDATSLLTRMGTISSTRGMQYWSVTDNAWQVLIKDASALSGERGGRRGDFSAAELARGATVYFVEQDNRSEAPVTYEMRIVESTPERIVVETENVTPIKALLATLFAPRTMKTAYILTRMDARTWGLYVISAATDRASGMVSLAKTSYENRARALFAHFAGVQPTR